MIKKAVLLTVLALALSLSVASFAEGLKVGYVDMRKVFFEYKKTKDFNSKLEKEDEKVKKEIDAKAQEIRKFRDEIELLSDDAKKKKEPELRARIKGLDDFRREKVEEFIRKKDEMFKEIREDIMSVSSKYAAQNGYDVIFDEAIFVYAANKFDITEHVIKQLNK